ncbi:MAG: hypothetical protein HKP54_06625 [Boseongicola sp.]|nr:hypothetical protein [Boseongicola sp.]
MSVYGNGFWSELDGVRGSGRVEVRETHWGLIIKDADKGANKDHISEGILKVLGVVDLFASVLPWGYTGGPLGDAAFMTQLSLSAAFIVTGFGIYTHAGRGFRQEVHLDGIQSEVRFATRNSRDISTVRRQIPMMLVQSCFLKRTKAKKASAQLHLRLKSKGPTLRIASGEERNLVPVLEQMADLIKVTERSKRF